ncbi:MAG: hypothetical protein JWN70_1550, partial [Planctomycetaceae bacterium]|nr:hypothetical protein [Planctomycetaceae bacterium]
FESAANLRAQFEGAHPFEIVCLLRGSLEFASRKSFGAASHPGFFHVSSIRWLRRGVVELSRQRWISAGCSREAAVGSFGTGCSMLLEIVNMADVARGMGPQVTRSGKGGNPSLKVRQPAPKVEKTSGAAQTVREGGNVRAEAGSDIQRSGPRLDRRAELVKLAQPLLDQGVSIPEVHAALEEFVQRKEWGYLSPATRDDIVESAFDALVDAEMKEAAAEEAAQRAASLAPQPDELQEVSLADIAPEPVRWLWPGKIPLGRVTVIYGEAGLGKTSLGLDLAARVSAGTNWPDGTGAPEAGRVLIVNGEDPLQDTICPRLRSSGAKVENISVIAGMQTPATGGSAGVAAGGASVRGARGFDLGRDLPVLRKRVETLGNVRLVIIDPLEAYCGKVGSNRVKLRELVAELTKLAADCGVAVVVISAATKCDLPIKHVWRVDCQVLDATARCWVPVRHNCGALPDGLAFRINADGVVWQQGGEAPTESRVRGTSARGERCRQLQEQATWLRDFLNAEPHPAKEVLAAAGAAGWSTGQMKRAKRELGIRCYKESAEKGRWIWSACGEKVEGSELRVDLRQVEEIKEFKEVAVM